MHTRSSRRYAALHAGAMMSLFCVGLYAASFGPALPFIADDLDVSVDTAGLLLTGLFVGSIAASAVIAVALHAIDVRTLAAAGLVAAIAGLLLLAVAPSFGVAMAGAAVLGIGDGLMIASLHMLMAATSDDVPAAMNRLNLYFAIGAVAGPLWAGGMLASSGDRWIVYAGMAAVVAATLAVMLAASGATHGRIDQPDEAPPPPRRASVAWVMGAVLFLYVGAEFGLGAWVTTYIRESTDAGVFLAAALTSGYWFALMLGRLLSAAYFRDRRDPSLLLLASVAGAGVASLALALATGNIGLSAVAVFAAGLFLGPVWPATVAIASEGNPAQAAAVTVTIGNAGGVAIPWLQGRVLVDAGPSEGVAVSAVLCAVMLVIVAAFRVRAGRTAR